MNSNATGLEAERLRQLEAVQLELKAAKEAHDRVVVDRQNVEGDKHGVEAKLAATLELKLLADEANARAEKRIAELTSTIATENERSERRINELKEEIERTRTEGEAAVAKERSKGDADREEQLSSYTNIIKSLRDQITTLNAEKEAEMEKVRTLQSSIHRWDAEKQAALDQLATERERSEKERAANVALTLQSKEWERSVMADVDTAQRTILERARKQADDDKAALVAADGRLEELNGRYADLQRELQAREDAHRAVQKESQAREEAFATLESTLRRVARKHELALAAERQKLAEVTPLLQYHIGCPFSQLLDFVIVNGCKECGS
jgi:chromosome segregation ATPase